MTPNAKKKFVPQYSIHWTRTGATPPPPYCVSCKGGIMEALLWFHLQRQLKDGLKPADYSIQQVTTDHDSPQRWNGSELPPVSSVNRCTVTPEMAKQFAEEIRAAQAQGYFIYGTD
jgi:hypothetical protein